MQDLDVSHKFLQPPLAEPILTARAAESFFWMARYIERCENLTRLLTIYDLFVHQEDHPEKWQALLSLFGDQENFLALYPSSGRGIDAQQDALNIMRFYLVDNHNPGSVRRMIAAARENARILRPMISSELWVHLNIFYNDVKDMTIEDIREGNFLTLCDMIREQCQAHTGMIQTTSYRDHGWVYYQLGSYLERADQTTRLIDSCAHLAIELDIPVEDNDWHVVLRAAGGYHAFRRVWPGALTNVAAVNFLLYDQGFVRSLSFCLVRVWTLVQDHLVGAGSKPSESLQEFIRALQEFLSSLPDLDVSQTLREQKLSEKIDQWQVQIARLCGLLMVG